MSRRKINNNFFLQSIREDTHKKVSFLVVGPIRFYPPYTNGLVVHATITSSYSLCKFPIASTWSLIILLEDLFVFYHEGDKEQLKIICLIMLLTNEKNIEKPRTNRFLK